MKKLVNGKNVNIPDNLIKKYMEALELTEEKAIQTYLEEEGYLENQEIEEMTKKAKANKTDKIVVTDKTTRKQVDRQPKENPTKEMIIDILTNTLQTSLSLENLQVTNKSKLIEFTYLGKQYKLDLIEKRQKK